MKRRGLLIGLTLLSSLFASAQNVLRVNNTPGINAPYSTVAAAVAAAGPNDIIMIEGSPVSYGTVTVSKKVTIQGPGYFLTENTGFQSDTRPATLTDLVLNAGADGSTIQGMELTGGFTMNNVSNITFSYNKATTGSGAAVRAIGTGSNILINQNYISYLNAYSSDNFTNYVITNNFFENGFQIDQVSPITISNNVIRPSGPNCNIANAIVTNNIFYTGSIGNTSGSQITYNVFAVASQVGADGTNTFNQSAAATFVGLAGNTTDTQWKIKAGSPALTAGVGGTECGMYGGSMPYRPSGIRPGQPTITSFSSPGTGIQNGSITIKVSAKTN